MRQFRIRAAVLLAAATTAIASTAYTAPLATAAPADSSLMAVEKTYVDADGVFHYAFDPSIRPGAATRTVQGSRGTAGCSFSFEESSSAGGGEGTTTVDELTYDPASCTFTFAITSSDGPLKTMGLTEPGSSEQASEAGGAAAAAASYTYWAAMYAFIEDPVFLITTSTKCIRYWSANGSWSNSHKWYWLSNTGWMRTSSGETNNSTTCDTRGNYSNLAFWDPTLWTYASHSKTKVVTSTTSGNFTTSYAMDKWGEKASWLSYHASSTSN